MPRLMMMMCSPMSLAWVMNYPGAGCSALAMEVATSS